ncbi:MAG: diguanylate cyclase [Sulfurimicrobium sp.]|nr:diguanylate cyclase [Sulfurimicrobium sp.]
MQIDDPVLHELAIEMGMTDEEIKTRKAFLEFDDKDIARLRLLHEELKDARAEVIDAFYDHLFSFGETRSLLGGDDSRIARLKGTQSQYFDRLTAGEYGECYTRDRLRIGIAHQRIGLDPKWYLGAYHKYLSMLFPHLWKAGGLADHATMDNMRALLKIVFFDMGIAIDTYIHDRQKNINLKMSQLAALNQVAAALTSSLSLREVLDEVMSCAIAFTLSRASCIAFYDQNEGLFKEWVTQGLSEHFISRMAFRRGGLADKAFTSGDSVLSNDLPGTRHQLSHLTREEGIRSFVCLPLTFQDQPLGVLYVYRDDRDDFHQDEIELLSTFANLAAGAINNARQHARMTDLASMDGLTGLYNRRTFDERLSIEAVRCRRYQNRYAMLMLDVDHFKRVNDAYGHPAGDAVLRFLAELLRCQIRTTVDMAARFGGEEFAILLPETDKLGAYCVAERIRRAVEESRIPLPNGKSIGVTVSIGVCGHPDCGHSTDEMIANADKVLYRAKQEGRNCTMVFGELPEYVACPS